MRRWGGQGKEGGGVQPAGTLCPVHMPLRPEPTPPIRRPSLCSYDAATNRWSTIAPPANVPVRRAFLTCSVAAAL